MSSAQIIEMIFAVSLLFLLSAISKKTQKSWFSPASFFPLVWFVFMSIGITLAPEFNPQLIGILTLILFSMSVIAGSVFIPRIEDHEPKNPTEKKRGVEHRINELFIITILLSVISTIGIGAVILFGFTRFQLEQNIFNLLVLPNLYATDRYDEMLHLPFFMKATIYLTYPAALIGGFTSDFYKGIKKGICYIPIFVTVLYGAIFAVRAGILLAFILAFSGILCAKIFTRANLDKWFKKVSFLGAITGLVLFVTYLLVQWLRKGPSEDILISELFLIAKAGILGSLSAFTHWIQSGYIPGNEYGLGVNTFAGPAEALGLTLRESGFYSDYAQIGNSYTNIYTAFRGIISDFGILGAAVFSAIFGFIASLSFKATWDGKVMGIAPLSAFYTFTLFSPLLSIFAFNSIIIAFIVFFAILMFSNRAFV